ncbi:MAG: UDP-N-acetylmuramoyl-L-alanyl-D-glutamate--2,6-diaminopimelate ligase [Candidatus Omnitrophota bacterium]
MKIKGVKIKGITANSQQVKKGFAFVAIAGNQKNGNLFIQDAIAKGATVVAAKQLPKFVVSKNIKLIKVNDCRLYLAKQASKFYGSVADKLKCVGITGTNGKTTVAYLIEAIAQEANLSCGVIGTINYRYKGKTFVAKNTTPGPVELQSLLARMHVNKIKYCAIEVSSHALDQKRVAGINFSTAIFTNLTQDHLDYHKSLEQYFLAKLKLFTGLSTSSIAIINQDDQYAGRIIRKTRAKIFTYGIDRSAMLMAKDINYGLHFTEFTLLGPKIKIRLKTQLTGKHNIYNLLASVAWGLSQKLDVNVIKSAIEKFKNVPGRLEKINSNKGFGIFVDYAHTPDALFNVITALRPLVEGKIIIVFGCGGERDKLKRPKMGKVVSKLADYAIITDDNPRSENPKEIIKEICKGIKKNNYCIKGDRFEAIRAGLAICKKGDCLLIAGKGHECCQILKNKILTFSDQKVVKQCLKLMK